MKNNQGFTIIELVVSFGIVLAVASVLITIVITLNKMYQKTNIKTNLITDQSLMTKTIYDDIENKNIKGIKKCGTSCVEFTFYDNTKSKLDITNNKFTYGTYSKNIVSNTTVSPVTYIQRTSLNSSYFIIKIPFKNKLFDEDYGISITKYYNHSLYPLTINEF